MIFDIKIRIRMCLNSVDSEWLWCDKFGLFFWYTEVVQDGRIRWVSCHVIRHKLLFLVVQCCLASNSAEVFFAHPFALVVFGGWCAKWLSLTGTNAVLVLWTYPYAWLNRTTINILSWFLIPMSWLEYYLLFRGCIVASWGTLYACSRVCPYPLAWHFLAWIFYSQDQAFSYQLSGSNSSIQRCHWFCDCLLTFFVCSLQNQDWQAWCRYCQPISTIWKSFYPYSTDHCYHLTPLRSTAPQAWILPLV